MPQSISGKDIENIFSILTQDPVRETKLFAGEGENKKPIVSKGFKLQDPKSGLVYTVIALVKQDNKYYLNCERGDGVGVKISEKDLNSYKRL